MREIFRDALLLTVSATVGLALVWRRDPTVAAAFVSGAATGLWNFGLLCVAVSGALSLPQPRAGAYLRAQYLLRTALAGAVLGFASRFSFQAFWATLLGLSVVRAAIYLYGVRAALAGRSARR
ncbi:MAG: ATP synthase subunit I [Bacillota bacterium]|nr:ATP synthase subunit I [Bacillota bacterium]